MSVFVSSVRKLELQTVYILLEIMLCVWLSVIHTDQCWYHCFFVLFFPQFCRCFTAVTTAPDNSVPAAAAVPDADHQTCSLTVASLYAQSVRLRCNGKVDVHVLSGEG